MALLGFCTIQSRNEPIKRSILLHSFKSNFQMPSWMKWKGNWNWNKYLYPQKLSKSIFYIFSQKWVKFDRFGNNYLNRAFFEVIETDKLCIKQTVLKQKLNLINFKIKFHSKAVFRETVFICKLELFVSN